LRQRDTVKYCSLADVKRDNAMSDFGLFLLFFAALACMVGVIRFFAWLTDIQESGGFVAAIQRAQDRYLISKADRVMSNSAPVKEYEQPDPVYIPVPHTSMPASGILDIDAEKPEMPRLSRDITDNEMLFFLAVVRNKDGRYRYSANAIWRLLGGDRNSLLVKIKEIRTIPAPPEYRAIDEKKQPVLN
jgi:hypothetical protein